MAAVVCENCGTSNPAGRQFCENCDGFLDWSGVPDAGPVAAAPAPVAPVAPQQQAGPQQAPPPPTAPGPATFTPPYRPAAPPPPSSPSPMAAPPPHLGPPHPGATFAPVGMPPMSTAPLQRTCSNCGTASDPQRRFCRRCGTWLVTPTLVAPAPPDRLGRRLRRRWWGGTSGAYSGDLTRGTVAFRILSVVLVLALVTGVLTLAGWHPIRRVTDLVGHVTGSGRVERVTAQALPADALPGYPASWGVDDVRGRGFATRWTSGSSGDPRTACAGAASATASTLLLTLPQPTDVREIGIEAGLPAGDPQLAARWRPQTLELRWNNGKCQVVQLAKDPGLQRFAVDQGTVSQVTVVVVAGYPPDGQGSDRLDIGEITFWRR
jgi:hypothetical protein